MNLKALGAVVALLAVSVVFAQTIVTRVIARGYAISTNNERLDFNFSAARMQSGSSTRYLGSGSFRWRSGSTLHSASIRRINSMTVTAEGDTVIQMSGTAELRRGSSLLGGRTQSNVGAFTLQVVDRADENEPDTIEFTFSAGAGLNAVNINYSGTVQDGSQLTIRSNSL